MSVPDRIARLAISLDEVKPPVRRRLEASLAIRLERLHRVFQIVMGWENYHLYEFRVGRDIAYGVPDPDGDFPGSSPYSANKATLADLLAQARNKTFKYVYDFGDDWQHTVKLEALAAPEPGTAYPRLLSAKGRCPPEDVGGPWGYAEYLEAIADPSHERHAEMVEWRGSDFDPNAVDAAAIQKQLDRLAPRRKTKIDQDRPLFREAALPPAPTVHRSRRFDPRRAPVFGPAAETALQKNPLGSYECQQAPAQ